MTLSERLVRVVASPFLERIWCHHIDNRGPVVESELGICETKRIGGKVATDLLRGSDSANGDEKRDRKKGLSAWAMHHDKEIRVTGVIEEPAQGSVREWRGDQNLETFPRNVASTFVVRVMGG